MSGMLRDVPGDPGIARDIPDMSGASRYHPGASRDHPGIYTGRSRGRPRASRAPQGRRRVGWARIAREGPGCVRADTGRGAGRWERLNGGAVAFVAGRGAGGRVFHVEQWRRRLTGRAAGARYRRVLRGARGRRLVPGRAPPRGACVGRHLSRSIGGARVRPRVSSATPGSKAGDGSSESSSPAGRVRHRYNPD
jgi:hypothetical protein